MKTVLIAISVVGYFTGWSNELHCLNIFLILLQFGKEKEKKKRNEFDETLFFGCICWDCSFSVAEFSISQSSSSEHVNRLMSHSKNLGNIKVKVTLTTRNPPTKYLTKEIVQFLY